MKRERSIINRVNWDGIGKTQRQFARLLVKDGTINANDRLHVRQLILDLKGEISDLKKLYPETHMKFKELSERDELPKLHLTLDEAIVKSNNPFGVNRSY